MKEREKFGSRLGFILVSAGCAVGLGNVWKFPYMTGKNGGAAFILIYLLFLVLMGLPIMVAEFSVGRASQKSVASSFKMLQAKGRTWHKFGYIAMLGNYILMMFYTMVGGWMIYYMVRMARGDFSGKEFVEGELAGEFTSMLASPGILGIFTFLAILISFGICSFGVQKGVERITKFMMTALLLLIFILVIRSVTLKGAAEGLKFYLIPDFKKVAEIGVGNVIFGAMSQAFFTLSIGMGSMAIFGSYLGKDRSLMGESIGITILDTLVAVCSGLIIIPACFAFGVKPDAGPSLIFITLPHVFNQMPIGRLWGSLFFLFLSFAALTTIIAVFENIISFAIDLWGWKRKKAVIVNILLISVLTLPCILGFNVWSGFQPLGPGSTIMDLEDLIVSNTILPLGSMVYLIFCTRDFGWGWDGFIKEANTGFGVKLPLSFRFHMTNIIPLLIIVIYLKGYYDLFVSKGHLYLVTWMILSVAFLGLLFYIMLGKKKTKKDN
ncbi:MAG TPA: sodium-dependent transporter [Lachnospiraceae bacterium]